MPEPLLDTPITHPCFQVKIHGRRRLQALPTHQQGWWNSQPNGSLKMRPSTAADLAGVYLKEGASHNPADYLTEANGPWVLLRAAAQRIVALPTPGPG